MRVASGVSPSLKIVGWALCALLCAPRGAFGQSAEEKKAAAEALFDEGRKLVKAGNFAAACPRFVESQRIDPGVGTLLHLADCYERAGKTASAWATFREAASAAKNAGQADRARTAEQRAAGLEPKLSRVTISLAEGAGAAGLVIRRDDAIVTPALLGTSIPVDPGRHVISAEAPGRKPWKREVEVNGQVSVQIPPLLPGDPSPPSSASAPPAPPSASSPPPPASASSAPPPPASASLSLLPTSSPPPSSLRTVALVSGGVGLIAAGVGAYFGYRAYSTYEDRKQNCSGNLCEQKGFDLDRDAHSQARLSNIFFAVGAVGLVTGAVIYLGPARQKSALAPAIGPGFAGVSLAGALLAPGRW